MTEAIRFYLDQHIPSAVSEGLVRHGVDVLTAQQAGRCGETDEDQLAYAKSENRVLVSFDSDFLALHQAGVEHGGIVWCPEQKHGVGDLIKALLLVHAVLDNEDMQNHVEYM